MTIQEFYEIVEENYFQMLEEYNIKRDSCTDEKYIISPIKSKEYIIDTLEEEAQDPWEDIEECSKEEEARLLEEVKANILKRYEQIIAIRYDFMKSLHPEEEYMEIFEN